MLILKKDLRVGVLESEIGRLSHGLWCEYFECSDKKLKISSNNTNPGICRCKSEMFKRFIVKKNQITFTQGPLISFLLLSPLASWALPGTFISRKQTSFWRNFAPTLKKIGKQALDGANRIGGVYASSQLNFKHAFPRLYETERKLVRFLRMTGGFNHQKSFSLVSYPSKKECRNYPKD